MKTSPNDDVPAGMGWRVAVSILAFFGSIIGIILCMFFYAEHFNIYQNIAIVIALLIAFVATMGATWAPWGMKQVRQSKNGE